MQGQVRKEMRHRRMSSGLKFFILATEGAAVKTFVGICIRWSDGQIEKHQLLRWTIKFFKREKIIGTRTVTKEQNDPKTRLFAVYESVIFKQPSGVVVS